MPTVVWYPRRRPAEGQMHAPQARSIDRQARRRTGEDPTRRALAAIVAVVLGGLPSTRGADALDSPVTALWTAVPLRAWAGRATVLAGRPVVVDRRLDPECTVTRSCRGEPLGDVLTAVADAAGAAVEPLHAWIRLAPAAEAGRAGQGERLRTREIAALPAEMQSALGVRRPWSWPDGARPRDLVASAAADAGVEITGVDAVPHDHLPAADLPALTLPERLDIVLAQYDLRGAWTAAAGRSQVRIVPLEAAPLAAATRHRDRRPSAGQREPRPRHADRFTLRLEAPLDEALEALAAQLGLEAEIDHDSLAARGILPREIVRAAVTDATREQLLDAVVGPLGLRWRIEGRRLLVDAPAP